MVPPIARNAAYKAGFLPNYEMMAGSGQVDRCIGFDEVVSDLTAAGNLGLMLAVDGYRLGKNVKFYTYAEQCVRREIWKQATFLRSAVRRKDGSEAKWDVSIDPLMPDVHHVHDNVGSRANLSGCQGRRRTTTGNETPASQSHARLRPQPSEPKIITLDGLTKIERRIIQGRMRGLKLRELAKELGLSTATVWRREQSAFKRIRANGNADCRGAARDSSSPGDHGLHE